jgi:hypothetical protein
VPVIFHSKQKLGRKSHFDGQILFLEPQTPKRVSINEKELVTGRIPIERKRFSGYARAFAVGLLVG